MLTQFDPDKGVLLQGEFTRVAVVDPAIPGHEPNHVLDRDKNFQIELEWRLTGSDMKLYLAALKPADWDVAAYAESVGPGPEIILAEGTEGRTNFTKDGDDFVWKHTLDVPANTLQEEDPGPTGPSGVYLIVATVFLNSTLGEPGYDIAGFNQGPLIKVESPV